MSDQTLQNQPKRFNIIKILLMLVIAGVSWVVLKNIFSYQNFQKAEKAYQSGDCKEAVAYDTKFLESNSFDFDDAIARSQARQSECQQFLSASEVRKSSPAEALIKFIDFDTKYPDTPINKPLRQEIASIFSDEPITTIAQIPVCNQIEPLKKLISEPVTDIPSLYQNCGNTYHAAKQYEQAQNMYEAFLAQYPSHSQKEAVKKALATTIIADARQKGAGNLPPPPKSGFTSDGSTIVEIRNDSPNKMRIVFSGPETQLKELPECTKCQKYNPANSPKYCPEKGPVERYVLKPGTYDVVVESIESIDVVKPYVGQWTVSQGGEYINCFFIITEPVGN